MTDRPMSPREFIDAIAPAAQECQRRTGIPASFTIAQGALESGWGRHAPGRNLFGIKAGTSWRGDCTEQTTRECIDGRWIVITDRFRAYTDWQGSIDDHAELLCNARYRPALQYASDPVRYAVEVQRCGYATDPQYGEKLGQIIRQYRLTEYDVTKVA